MRLYWRAARDDFHLREGNIMSAATMWAAMQTAIAAVTPYQGNDPVASAAYRAAVGQAMCSAIISEYSTPLVWSSGADLQLDIGQSAKITASGATSIPLHVACGDGQVYEMVMAGTYTAAAAATDSYLQPNNAVPATNAFSIRGIYLVGTTLSTINSANNASGGFDLCAGGASILESKFTVFTSTSNKKAEIKSGSTTNAAGLFTDWVVEWQDTTNVWSSLGTIIMPNAWTGSVVVTRVQ